MSQYETVLSVELACKLTSHKSEQTVEVLSKWNPVRQMCEDQTSCTVSVSPLTVAFFLDMMSTLFCLLAQMFNVVDLVEGKFHKNPEGSFRKTKISAPAKLFQDVTCLQQTLPTKRG